MTRAANREVQDGIRRAIGMCNRKVPHEAIRAELWAALQKAQEAESGPVPLPITADALNRLLLRTAVRWSLTVEEIAGNCRERGHVLARREFAVEARKLGCSYPQIGRVLHKHHSSVIHMARRAKSNGFLIVKDKVNDEDAVQRLKTLIDKP